MRASDRQKFPILQKKNPTVDEMDEKQLDEKLKLLKAKSRKLKALKTKQDHELAKNDAKAADLERQIEE